MKNALNGYLSYSNNGTKDAVMDDNNGVGYIADTDRGKKVSPCPPTNQWYQHYRVYAPNSTDRMYDPVWGYYIIGTEHYDINDGCASPAAGYSETAEGWLAQWSRNVWGAGNVLEDFGYFSNEEPFLRSETSDGRPHIWDVSDGKGTMVYVP